MALPNFAYDLWEQNILPACCGTDENDLVYDPNTGLTYPICCGSGADGRVPNINNNGELACVVVCE